MWADVLSKLKLVEEKWLWNSDSSKIPNSVASPALHRSQASFSKCQIGKNWQKLISAICFRPDCWPPAAPSSTWPLTTSRGWEKIIRIQIWRQNPRTGSRTGNRLWMRPRRGWRICRSGSAQPKTMTRRRIWGEKKKKHFYCVEAWLLTFNKMSS